MRLFRGSLQSLSRKGEKTSGRQVCMQINGRVRRRLLLHPSNVGVLNATGRAPVASFVGANVMLAASTWAAGCWS